MKTEYIVGGVVLVGIVGYFLVSSQLAKAASGAQATPPAPLPSQVPALPPAQNWPDYQTVQLGPSQTFTAFEPSSMGVIIRIFKPGDSILVSAQENKALAAAGIAGEVFYANDSGVTRRYWTSSAV
ncbi:MAG: hypothetical protein ACYDH4_10670 [Candidatus Cryosericum sp.]